MYYKTRSTQWHTMAHLIQLKKRSRFSYPVISGYCKKNNEWHRFSYSVISGYCKKNYEWHRFLIHSLVDIVKKQFQRKDVCIHKICALEVSNIVLNLYVVQLICQMLEDKR